MQFTKQDLANAQNLIKLLAKSKIEMDLIETIPAAEALKFFSRLVKTMEEEINAPQTSTPKPPQQQTTTPTPVKIEENIKKPVVKKK
jgi:hypothetical protein